MARTSSPRSTNIRPTSLACDECRRKHLKCDGLQPVCRRCSDNSSELSCTYTPSRRGRRRPSRRTHLRHEDSGDANDGRQTEEQRSQLPSAQISPIIQHRPTPSTARSPPQQHDDQLHLPTIPAHDVLIDLFYFNVWPAHPFLVPRRFFTQQHYPAYLVLVICDLGQRFSANSTIADPMLHDAAIGTLTTPDEMTIHRVQALLLAAILLHADHEPKEADRYISRAARIADQLAIHRTIFTNEDTSSSCFLIAESYRRTWWELYLVDAYLAGLHHRQRCLAPSSENLPLLPSSQAQYETGQYELANISIYAFEQRVFLESPGDFSSHCYRIEAARIVERVLSVAGRNDAQPDDVQAIDNALASWKYNLTYPDVITSAGEVDEILFQAHCYIACASIFLHFPRSDLPATVPSTARIACSSGYSQLSPTSAQHTIKAIAASKELSNLAAIPWPLERHSPLFACAMILACIVQLAAATIHLHHGGYHCLQHHRDRVVLIIGALRHLGTKWSVASNAAARLRPIANMVLHHQCRDEATTTSYNASLIDSGIGVSADDTDISWFNLFDSTQLMDEGNTTLADM